MERKHFLSLANYTKLDRYIESASCKGWHASMEEAWLVLMTLAAEVIVTPCVRVFQQPKPLYIVGYQILQAHFLDIILKLYCSLLR